MSRRHTTVSFLSDYGLADEFVGVVKAVIRSIAPEATVIDITHEIPPHDVRAGALTLARSAQYLNPGVVLAVVDPGVGTARRAVAVEVGGGQSVLVGPDNGLLAGAVAMVGGADRAVELTNATFQLPAPGPTFAGRDVFAPAAAHLCAGVELTDLGDRVDPGTLRPGVLPVAREEGGGLVAEVLWVDRFGNAQLNVDPDDIDDWGDVLRLVVSGVPRVTPRAHAYDDLADGQVGLVVDSYGMLSVAVPRGSAAAELGLHPGTEVVLTSLSEQSEPGSSSPVDLRGRSGS
jgi:S-adenosylmethionine hydrolase